MASTRKLRNVNKRFSKDFEGWPDNDRASANKSTPRKRKLSDMLGSQWSKEELERFYEAYRKYGKDWKKIASTVRNRSHEMVEALYSMNKAYLSLPEGTATAAGLIAMMTDHYNILEGSDSDGESNDGSKTSRKPQKRGRGKFRAVSKVSDGCSTDQALLNPSRYGCLSLLKKQSGDPLAGNRPRAVGKRTPRVPVSNMYNKNDKGRLSLVEPPPKSELAADDEGAHVAALALAEVLQRGGSPQVSRTPRMRVYQMKSSPVKSTEDKSLEPEMGRSKLTGVTMNDDCLEASLGSREAENGDFVREGTDGIEASKKVKKRHGKSPQVNTKNIQIDDDREACSGTEEGSTIRKIKDEIDMEIRDSRPARGPKSSRKRSRQLFFGDESSALDALQTLADLSVNLLPVSAAESESSTQVKEEKPKINSDQKSNMPEQFLPSHHPVKANILGKKERINASSTGSDVINKRSPKVVKGLHQDTNAISEMNQQACACASRMDKRKGKSANVKILKSEFTADSKKSELQKTEVSTDEGKVSKVKRSVQVSPQLKQGKLQKVQENSSVTESVVPVVSASGATVQIAGESQTSLVTKRRSRRKLDLQKAQALKESKSHETSKDHCADRPSYAFSWMDEIKEKLPHCLSCKLLRRWCMFEWFYSAIDYPWFAKSEFVEYLNHVRLGHIPRLTRVEWGVIRSSLGKPRRLSNQFLQEEREKLEQYRESVRMHYAEFRVGLREGLPTDLAKPLQVGQRVIACHPKTREIHDGSVLTVDRNRCRIQFDRPQLGVEFVMDIDCMPLNPLENIPEALRVHNIGFRRYSNSISNITANENGWKSGGSMKLSPDDSVDVANGNSPVLASSYPMSTLMKQAKGDTIDAVIQAKATVHEVAVAAQQAIYSQPFTLSQIQEREADIRALAELSRALDKKEALLIELRHMNEVAEKQKDDDTIKDLENFRKQYAIILVQLRDVNDQVASSLHSLRQRNTYHGSSTLPWIGTMETSGGPVGPPEAFNQAFMNQDSGSHVVQIVETSRQKARRMVDTAVQALCALNEGEDPFTKIGEALDSTHIRDPVSGGSMPGAPSPFAGHTLPANQDNAKVCTLDPSVHVPGSKPNDSSAADLQLPSDLISSCVSILLMIQTCTERQYPPAEIAQILDSAVASLQPCCPQNLPIYREIESCMGIIKNQMLSLIPTPSNISLSEIAIG